MSAQTHMSQSDFLSWRMEADPVLRSTIVAFGLLDRAPDWDRLVAISRRGVGLVDTFRCKAVPDSLGLAPPQWVPDPDFELSWHLRRFTVTEPSYERLLEFVSTESMTAFDKERPLWRFTLLDGLPDGRAALVMTLHHSLTDGMGGMQIARHLVDFTREGDTTIGGWEAGERAEDPAQVPPPGRIGWYADSLGSLLRETSTSLARAGGWFARDPLGALVGAAALASSTLRFARPILHTRSPLMAERSTRRNVAVLDVSLDALRTAANAAGVSINDAFLAAVLHGMSLYHDRHGTDAPELRVTLPISLRTKGDPIGGNRITLARMTLPSRSSDPAELMREIHATVGEWRAEPAIPFAPAIAGAFNVLPASTLGDVLKHVDFVASNVPGSPVPAYVAGAEILGFYAFGPTLGAAFNVTLMSHMSRCAVSIHADAAAVPDLDDCKAAIVDGFEAVLACSGESKLPGDAVITSLDGPAA